MRDIQKEIQENLDAIENRYDVRILLAVESEAVPGALPPRTVIMMCALSMCTGRRNISGLIR